MNRSLAVLSVIIIGICAYGVFQIKHQVKSLVHDLMEVNQQIASDKEAIYVLKAEWTYLNRPERLKELASKYLNLDHIVVSQIDTHQVKDISAKNYSYATIVPVPKPILASIKRYE